MNIRMGFSAALKRVRKERKLTQEDFSEISSRTYLSSLERGMKSPTLEKIDQLASILNIHPVTLILLSYAAAEKRSTDILEDQIHKEVESLVR